jgi:hypothetical protein
MGHKAAHICFNPDCVCHSAEGYGLELDGARYRRRLDVYDGVAVLDVFAGVRLLRLGVD